MAWWTDLTGSVLGSLIGSGGIVGLYYRMQMRDLRIIRLRQVLSDDRFEWRTLRRITLELGCTETEARQLLLAIHAEAGEKRDGTELWRLPKDM